MIRKWLFIDEHLKEAGHCAELLAQKDELEVETKAPEADLRFITTTIKKSSFTGVLLDHALNEGNGSRGITYTGATLAAYIRTEYPHLPVVALSAKLKDPAEFRRYRRTEELFDLKLDKQYLTTDADKAREQLKALDDGYRTLQKILGAGQFDSASACSILGIPCDLDEDTERAAVAHLMIEEGDGEPHPVAHFLIHVALRLQGPLLDRRRAAVALGMEPGDDSRITEYLAPASYQGVFQGLHPEDRYWREALNELESAHEGVASAQCLVCGEPAFEVCEQCERPVDGIHSLPVRRNGVANDMFLRGRVCAFCLENISDHLTIDGRYGQMREALIAQAKKIQETNGH